jgi:hypothetical protein
MSKTFSLVISNDSTLTSEEIDLKAKEYRLSKNAFVLEAISFFMEMDPEAWRQIKGWADALRAPAAQVISNIFTAIDARRAARIKVWGKARPELLEEFLASDDGLITGKEYFDSLYPGYLQEEEQKKIEALLRRELHPELMSQQDRDYLMQHRAGRTWAEYQEAWAREHEEEVKKIEARLRVQDWCTDDNFDEQREFIVKQHAGRAWDARGVDENQS